MTSNQLFHAGKWKETELEKDFQDRVAQHLRFNGWRVYAIADSRRASLAGYPDLTCWHPKQKRIMFCELKREKGRVSEAQKIVLAELAEIAETYLWRPSDWNDIVRIAKEKP